MPHGRYMFCRRCSANLDPVVVSKRRKPTIGRTQVDAAKVGLRSTGRCFIPATILERNGTEGPRARIVGIRRGGSPKNTPNSKTPKPAPRQKCGPPPPKATWSLGWRSMSKRNQGVGWESVSGPKAALEDLACLHAAVERPIGPAGDPPPLRGADELPVVGRPPPDLVAIARVQVDARVS